MADLARIKRNVARMVQQSAPEADIDAYIGSEGVTLDQVRAFKTGKRNVQSDADFREDRLGQGGLKLRLADNLSFGAYTPVTAAVQAGLQTVGDVVQGKDPQFWKHYTHERDVQDELLRRSRGEAGVAGTAAEIGLSLPFMAGNPANWARVPGYAKQLADAAKAGALYSGIYGFNSARGGVGEHVSNTAKHAAVGAVAGPALHAGITAASRVPGAVNHLARAATGRNAQRVLENQNRLAQFADANVRPFGPAVAGSDNGARMLSRSMVGGDLRAGAQGSIDDVTAQAQRVLQQGTGGRPVNDLGEEVQSVLRRNLTEHSRRSNDIRSMSDEELSVITGAPPRPRADPIEPRHVDDVAPRSVDPDSLTYPHTPPRDVPQPRFDDLDAAIPKVEDMNIPRLMANRFQKAYARDRQTREKLEALRAGKIQPERPPSRNYSDDEIETIYRDLWRGETHPDQSLLDAFTQARAMRQRAEREILTASPPAPKELGGAGATPQQTASYQAARRQLEQARSVYNEAADALRRRADKVFRGNPESARRVIQERDAAGSDLHSVANAIQSHRQKVWDRDVRGRYETAASARQKEYDDAVAAARREADEATEAARQQAIREAEEAARRDAADETARLRQQAQTEAEEATRRRQADLDARYNQDRHDLRSFEPGRSNETYPTEFSAAYERLNRETPAFQRNPLGRAPTRARAQEDTATSRLLNEFGLEGRRRLKLPGFRDGQAFGQDGRQDMGFGLSSYLDELLGADIAGRLQRLASDRARNRFAAGPQALRDLATDVRRARQSAERQGTSPSFPGEPRPERAAALRRLEGALREDYHNFVRETGEAGGRLSESISRVDETYARYIDDLRRPLARIFDERKVSPIQAMDRLAAAARDGDLRTLRAFTRVMAEKGDATRAASAIVSHITQGARTMDDFLRGYQAIPRESRDVLFRTSEARHLRTQLDRLEAIARRMEPFQRAIERTNANGSGIRVGHIPLGAGLFFHFIPTMAIYGGSALTARFMASPRYVNWLTRAASIRRPQAMRQHFGRLSAIATQDNEYGSQIMQGVEVALQEAMSVPDARATE